MTILILEDDSFVASGLVRAIGYLGHRAVHLTHVEEAQALVDGGTPLDAAFIDIGLDDGQSGEDFVTWLRRNHPAIKRVLISGLARPRGFIDDPPRELFQAKPFGQRELAALLNILQADATKES